MSGFGLGVSFVVFVQMVKCLKTVGQIVPTGISLALAKLHQESKWAMEPKSIFAYNEIVRWVMGLLRSSRKEEAAMRRFPFVCVVTNEVPGEQQV